MLGLPFWEMRDSGIYGPGNAAGVGIWELVVRFINLLFVNRVYFLLKLGFI